MKRLSLAITGLAVAFGAMVVPAAPASASIHEIVAQWCSGKGPLEPPGIQSGDNFARPVIANGFVGDPVPFRDGLLINFNFGLPSSKVIGTGTYIVIGSTPAGPLYLQLIEPDPNFPAFQRCPRLAG